MKNYTITVNGNVYDVTVEEGAGSGAAPAAAPKAAPKAAPRQHLRQHPRLHLQAQDQLRSKQVQQVRYSRSRRT